MKSYPIIIVLLILGIFNCEAQKKKLLDFVPEGYTLFEKHFGDLNKDGLEDCVLIIKNTNKENIVINRFNKKVDQNRRGIFILLKNEDSYQLAAQNYNCFSSENEDGGVYYPPELLISIEKGNLIIYYGHGRYGFWRYNFRFQNSSFELIGYDISSGGAIIDSELSINFLTKKKLIIENINEEAEGGDEIFKETWEDIDIEKLIKLSEIKDFDVLNMSVY